jgi:Caspase domain
MSSNFFALLIGVGGYAPSRMWPNLRGTVRDIDLVEDYLKQALQLESHQIVKLLSPNPEVTDLQVPPEQLPTYANIVKQFQNLTQLSESGDQIYIHYSGHGAQIATGYPELPNRRYDEGLVPCDIGTNGQYLRDVEMAFLLKQMTDKGLDVTIVLDSCNSGGATRGDYAIRGGTDPNPNAISTIVEREKLVANWQSLMGVRRDAFWVPPSNEYILLAACRSMESAFEYKVDASEFHGALTYWMIDTLKTYKTNLSFQALYDRVLAKIQSRFAGQVPLLIGNGKRPVFGGDLQVTPYTAKVLNINASKGTVTLDVGMAQGLLRGSSFSLYPFNTQDFTDLTKQIAVVEVTDVKAVSSTARVLSPEEGGIRLSGALDSLLEQGSPALPLSAPVELARTVRLFTGKSVGEGEGDLPADLASKQAEALEPIRQALKTYGKGWVVELPEDAKEEGYFQVAVARDGTYEICLGQPLKLRTELSISDSQSPKDIVERLIHVAKYKSIEALDNPANYQMTKALDFVLLDENLQPFENPEHPVVKAGDIVNLRIKNNFPFSLNIAVLDLEATWEISQFSLMGFEYEPFHPLQKDETIDLKLELSIPEDENCHEVDESCHEVKEIYKLFATKGPVDYRWLTLPPLDQRRRGPEDAEAEGLTRSSPNNPLGQLLEAIGDESDNQGTRASKKIPDPQVEWTTKQIQFTIKAE